MLEIFIIIALCRSMGQLARQKGLKAGNWKAYTALLWIGSEIMGFVLALLLFDYNLGLLFLFGYGLAIVSHLILRQNLKRRPDVDDMQDWVNQIGSDSVEPLPTQN